MMKKLTLVSLLSLAVLTLTSQGAQAAEYGTEGAIEFTPSTSITKPVDPTNPDPDKPVVPINPLDPDGETPEGTVGPLSIDFASTLDFGQNEISNKTVTYYANAQALSDGRLVPNYVQVTDNRGTNEGWTLQVKQNGQFTHVDPTAKNKVLTGAALTFEEGAVVTGQTGDLTAPVSQEVTLVPDASAGSTILSANDGAGTGTWVSRFGAVEKVTIDGVEVDKTKAISLEVPGKTPKDKGVYKTSLTWTLNDTPGNN